MGKATTPQSIEHLREALRELPIRIHRAILFGSRARGDYLEHSDWHVIVGSAGPLTDHHYMATSLWIIAQPIVSQG